MAKKVIPNDLVPFGAGKIVLTEINSDGTEGAVAKTFPQLLISSNVETTRENEELDTGEGAGIPFPSTEAHALAMVVNAHNTELHAILAGRDVTSGSMLVPTEMGVTMTKTGTDPSFKYSFVFPAGENVPTADADGKINIRLFDYLGSSMSRVTLVEDLQVGTFYYDEMTRTIETTQDYEGDLLTAYYFVNSADALKVASSDVIQATEMKVEMFSTMQSAKGKDKYGRYQVIERAVIDGNLPEPGSQKDINTNMTYNLVSQTPPVGKKAYTDLVWPL